MMIRQLDEFDASIYRRLRLEALEKVPEAFSASYEEEKEYSFDITKERLSKENIFTFGAFVNEKLVGTVTLIQETKRKLQHRGTIVAMYVALEHRGLGIGEKLVKQAIKKGTELQEMKQIYLAVASTNRPAKELYTKLGFKTYGVDKRAMLVDGDYYDEDLMVLVLPESN
ncbi:GNAT family N-acetyltransferase [Alteribacter aurantiacus]|uniref:GNAT family N-acetyltransferase n=1 Tax=Alteribacter aurantiacus TaxID=254410 RepID=UPI00041A0355|nr:GNAT family N-acetyltransferase [Alteribacter aurantiacus]